MLDMLLEFGIDFDLYKLSSDDFKTLINEYSDCIFLYHPENYHQERVAFLKQRKVLEKYGFSNDDYAALDFC